MGEIIILLCLICCNWLIKKIGSIKNKICFIYTINVGINDKFILFLDGSLAKSFSLVTIMNWVGWGAVNITMRTGIEAHVIIVSMINQNAVIFSTIYKR